MIQEEQSEHTASVFDNSSQKQIEKNLIETRDLSTMNLVEVQVLKLKSDAGILNPEKKIKSPSNKSVRIGEISIIMSQEDLPSDFNNENQLKNEIMNNKALMPNSKKSSRMKNQYSIKSELTLP